MRKPFIIFVAIFAIIAILILASHQRDFSVPELQKIIAQATELDRFCQSSKPDFGVIEKAYQAGPRGLVRFTDNALDMEMDDKIAESISAGRKGSIPAINAQIVDLTVTRVFFEYSMAHIKDTRDPEDLERAKTAFSALAPLVENADSLAGAVGNLSRVVHSKIVNLTFENATELVPYLQASLLINLAHEIDRAEEKSKELPDYFFHMARAVQFFHVLYQDISVRNRADAVFIYGELRKKPDQVDLAALRKKLFDAFSHLPYIRPDLQHGHFPPISER